MKIVQIKNFKGMNFHEGLWSSGYSKYTMGVDVYGLQDNNALVSIPGVIQSMRGVSDGTYAGNPNDMTDLVKHLAYFPARSTVFGISAPGGAVSRIYERTGGTWTKQGVSLTNSSSGGLYHFAGKLYYGTDSNLETIDGTLTVANVGAFTSSTTLQKPMRQLAGNLYIGNTRYISKVDSGGTFTANGLTLPSEFNVKSMDVYGNYLYIMADNASYSRMFVWDGLSPTYQDAFNLWNEAVAPYIIFHEGRIWAVAVRGSGIVGCPIYIFDGTQFTMVMKLPIETLGGLTILGTYRGNLLIGSNNVSASALYGTTSAGVWMVHRDEEGGYSAILAFPTTYYATSGTVGVITIGGLYASGDTIYFACTNNSTYKITEVNASNMNNLKTEWDSLPIDAGESSIPKMWHGIKIDSNLNTSSDSASNFSIYYRLDYKSTWLQLKTTINGNQTPDSILPIGRTSKVIEFQIVLGNGATGITPQIHGLTIYYDIGKQ